MRHIFTAASKRAAVVFNHSYYIPADFTNEKLCHIHSPIYYLIFFCFIPDFFALQAEITVIAKLVAVLPMDTGHMAPFLTSGENYGKLSS